MLTAIEEFVVIVRPRNDSLWSWAMSGRTLHFGPLCSFPHKDEDVRNRTYPIDCELHFMGFASELLCDE